MIAQVVPMAAGGVDGVALAVLIVLFLVVTVLGAGVTAWTRRRRGMAAEPVD